MGLPRVFGKRAMLTSDTLRPSQLQIMTPYTLAQLSDVHLSPLPGISPRYWNTKRALGLLNWHRKRRGVHRRDIADLLIADALSLRADHIAVTGDLINLGLPAEYEAALSWLQSIGAPENVTVVPGNHDVYTRLPGHPGVARWAAYMGREEQSLAFPFVRQAGPLTLLGLNSAIETAPLVASGQLGQHQIEVAGELLERLGNEGAIRVVLIHHPPLPGLASPRRALTDAPQFARMLERSGAELVLYGHNHRERLDWVSHAARRGGTGFIPVVGAPSASAGQVHQDEPLARYNLFTFFSGPRGVRIRHVVRGLDAPDGKVVKLSETTLETDIGPAEATEMSRRS